MSVYTSVSADELGQWLARYAVGAVTAFEPIATGIENSNYFVTTEHGRYVLTLFERLPAEDLPFYLNLMAHVAKAGVHCPAPEPDRTGALFSVLNGKPAALVTRLEGRWVPGPDAVQCAAVGEALAQLHVAAQTYRGRLVNPRGPSWWRRAAGAVKPFLDAGQSTLLAAELDHQRDFAASRLPRGAIHGDLFRDNVLFDPQGVPGIIDFGFAATDVLAYDLAITVNDWCVHIGGEQHGELVKTRVRAMVGGYQRVRALSADERAAWPTLTRAAALRFWLSRLYDLHLPRPGELVHAHDPSAFEKVLRARIADPPVLE